MQSNLSIVIVIYNIKIEDSDAFLKAFENKGRFYIIIVDNTSIDELRRYNQIQAEKLGVSYLTQNGNIGLSRGYNLAIDHIKKNFNSVDWVVTLDQDTILNQEYFDEILKITSRPSEMFLYYPKVDSKASFISPRPMNKQFIRKIENNANKNNIVCINSGLLINMELFRDCIYDENLFLDMIDYDLFCQIIKKGYTQRIRSINSLINQDFSGAGFSLSEKDYDRFKLYTADFKKFCCKWGISKIYKNYILFKRGIKLTIHYRSMKFINEIFKKSF